MNDSIVAVVDVIDVDDDDNKCQDYLTPYEDNNNFVSWFFAPFFITSFHFKFSSQEWKISGQIFFCFRSKQLHSKQASDLIDFNYHHLNYESNDKEIKKNKEKWK